MKKIAYLCLFVALFAASCQKADDSIRPDEKEDVMRIAAQDDRVVGNLIQSVQTDLIEAALYKIPGDPANIYRVYYAVDRTNYPELNAYPLYYWYVRDNTGTSAGDISTHDILYPENEVRTSETTGYCYIEIPSSPSILQCEFYIRLGGTGSHIPLDVQFLFDVTQL